MAQRRSLFFIVSLQWMLCFLRLCMGEPKRNLHSSCLDLTDGQHYLQLLTNDELSALSPSDEEFLTAPIVHVRCDKGHTIIDPSYDSGWSSYFSSFHQYTQNAAGPDLDDHSAWNEWFLINKLLNVQYTLSPDCKQCVTESQFMDTAYYMSGDIFSCYWPSMTNDDDIKCDKFDEFGYSECSKCGNIYSSNCASMIFGANERVYDDHQHCMESPSPNGVKLPSIGTNSQHCVCYKPLDGSTDLKAANWGNHYATNSWDEWETDVNRFDNEKEKAMKDATTSADTENESDEEAVNIDLYQRDFEHGTYRIRRKGTYTLQENIKFNFNPGGSKHPNAEFSWRPAEDQESDYPGAATSNFDGFYSLGFWAGITVESDDVIIDLNGHSIGMEYLFYLQQRFFVCISLTNKPPQTELSQMQMNVNGGDKKESAQHVVIKNGVIGLSSHIGIYCDGDTDKIGCDDVHFLNLKVRNFESHGIMFSNFGALSMHNIEIGPSVNGQLAVNNNYKASRFMLPIFYMVARENESGNVYFNERGPYTMRQILDRLVERMDLAFEYAASGNTQNIDTQSDEWKEAKKLFIDDTNGVSKYGTLYGLLLKNGNKNVQIDDLFVHDLIVNPQQIVKIGTSQDFWLRNSFCLPIDFDIAQQSDVEEAIYYGDVYSDALIAVRQLSASWWSLQQMVIWPEFIKWSQNGEPLRNYWPNNEIKRFCDDAESNGVIGVQIEGDAYNEVQFKDVSIDNLINMASFSISDCENNENEYLYEANYVRAINSLSTENLNIRNLNVSNILSFSGPSYGIWTNAALINLNFAQFSHIDAGIKAIYDDIDLNTQYGVNSAATSCSVYCEEDDCLNGDTNINEQCMNGHAYCKQIKFIHHINECPLDATYTTPIGTLLVRKNGQIKANLFEYISNSDQTPFVFRGEYFALTIVIILALLMAIKCIYFKSKKDSMRHQNSNYEESNPLLIVGDNEQEQNENDYDAIIIY